MNTPIPNPNAKYLFKKDRVELGVMDRIFNQLNNYNTLAERVFGFVEEKKSNHSSRQGISRKNIIMYEGDISGQMKRDAFWDGELGLYLVKPKYTKRSRRLFKQGLSQWSLSIREEI